MVLSAFPAMAGDWKKGTGENADSWWYDLGSGKWAKGWEWIDGDNDGMVSTDSMHWADFKGIRTSTTHRGISHADVVDMRRRRFTKKTPSSDNEVSDIVPFYVEVVKGLKEKGY